MKTEIYEELEQHLKALHGGIWEYMKIVALITFSLYI